MNEKVIDHRTADAMSVAGISEKTREILMVYAAFLDAEQAFYNWRNKYGYSRDDATNDAFANGSIACEKLILESVSDSISSQMDSLNFKDI